MPERALPLEVPGLRWSSGAPEPLLISSEDRTLLAFYLDERDVQHGREVGVAEFVGCTAVRCGFPNDEALRGHPLWGHGLAFYTLHEIDESTWTEALRAIEREHPNSLPQPFADARHFVLTFHDSTVEAIARDVVLLHTYTSLREAAAAMVADTGVG